MCAVLFDPEREVLPSLTASAALAEYWAEVYADMEELVEDMAARPQIAPALWAELMCRGWWGMPGYDDQVAAFVERGLPSRWEGTSEELAEALCRRPLDVPLAVWEQIVGGNGPGWLDRDEAP